MDRKWIQAIVALFTNTHLPNFLKGSIYQGKGKLACAPGLNCYSCPAAPGSCPVGAFQAVVGNSKFSFSYYMTGILIFLGVLLGRFVCGSLCPFGWFQELPNKLPERGLSTKSLCPLTFFRHAVLLFMVMVLPAFAVSDLDMGESFFCKYLYPQGVSEGAISLPIANTGIRTALGKLSAWKFGISITFISLSVFIYRPFCKWTYPLSASYALLNKVSLIDIRVDESRCISCGKCVRACRMNVDVTKTPDHSECICYGMYVDTCLTEAVYFHCSFGAGKTIENKKMKVK